jgi:quercetin dioxygenase-like cupin family protein
LNNLPGQEMLIFASPWQPGFRLPLHTHPNGHEVTYVVEGEQTLYIEGVGTKVVKAGDGTNVSSWPVVAGADPNSVRP